MSADIDLDMLRRVRLGQLKRVFRHRYGYQLPDDDPGRDDLELLLRLTLDRHMRNTAEIWAPWANGDADMLIAYVQGMTPRLRLPTPELLGKRLGLEAEEREQLKLWQIAPTDMSKERLAEWRKARDRDRKRLARAGAKPRAEYEGQSLSKAEAVAG